MLNRPPDSVGSSDANIIAKGEPVQLERCRQLFCGIRAWDEPSWFMQLGTLTESLHLDWQLQNELESMGLISTQAVATNDQRPRNHATTDAILKDIGGKFGDTATRIPFESKHVHTGWSWHGLIHEYYGQIQHIIDMTNADSLIFSAIFGNAEPAYMLIDRDNKFIANLRVNIDRFLAQCDSGEPYPLDEGLVSPLKTDPRTKGLKLQVDMHGNNAWGEAAHRLIETNSAIADNKKAKEALRDMADGALKATGHGVTVSMDKNGTRRVTIDK